ncbi:hypothetical protein PoB_002510000 [Plakobranchus ocellatus]|uniref:Uncharacterized protein n=1 Tax=Plakobranchus ocellatus TaxID=259542 RepID=A0AAV3ZTY8_9GAST|nr:hypothetical protein PoB_002510000 [Plakobranchus ocellatus]
MAWSTQLWAVLDTTVLTVMLFYKLPQIYEIVEYGSSRGISMAYLALEFVSGTIRKIVKEEEKAEKEEKEEKEEEEDEENEEEEEEEDEGEKDVKQEPEKEKK